MTTKAARKAVEVPNLAGELKEKIDPARIQVWERRLVNPGPESSIPIVLKEEGWTTRWINTAVEGRFHRATRGQGWVAVKVDDLADSPELLGFEPSTDGLVRRGNKGVEVLMKIPTAIFKRIQMKKADLEIKSLKNTKQNLASALGSRYGDQAGEWGQGASVDEGVGGLIGSIKDSRVSETREDGE